MTGVSIRRAAAVVLVAALPLCSSSRPATAAASTGWTVVQPAPASGGEPQTVRPPRLAGPWRQSAPDGGAGPQPAAPRIAGSQGELALDDFTGEDRASQISRTGISAEPPDPNLAVSPDLVAQAVNSVLRVTDRAGVERNVLVLDTIFALSPGVHALDPRILWDQASRRWFASAVTAMTRSDNTLPASSQVRVAVSQTADPAGPWRAGAVPTRNDAGTLHDQPRLGVSADKVTLAWDDFLTTSRGAFLGSQLWVLQKAPLLTPGDTVTPEQIVGFLDHFALMPAANPAGAAEQWVVFNDSTLTTGIVGVMKLVGTPADGGVGVAVDVRVTLHSTTLVPGSAAEPGSRTLDSGDPRFNSAVVSGSLLWMAGGDACQPAGDTTVRACLRYVGIDVSGSPALVTDPVIGVGGRDLFYPALAADGAGDVLSVYGFSSSTTPPGLGMTGRRVGAGAFSAPTDVVSGAGSYLSTGSRERWGDYFGAVVDPIEPAKVWVTGEYHANAATDNVWATRIARFTYAALDVSLADSPDPVTVGSTVTYTAQVKNWSSVTATGVTITDPLPTGMTFVAGGSDAGCAESGGVVTCPVGTLASGAAVDVRIAMQPSVAGDIVNTVAVGHVDQPDLTVAGNQASAFTRVDTTTPTAPASPANVRATASDGTATVVWDAPPDGGSSITSYIVTAAPGGATATAAGAQTAATVQGLTNGQTYTFTVVAVNAVGNSASSAPSNAVRPEGPPGAPGDVSATAGNGEATVTWTAADDGGSPVTGYEVAAADGSVAVQVGGDARSVTLTGLANGTAYRFTVAARNAHGLGPAAVSNEVTLLEGLANGYWLVASDGGIFSFGDASFQGSTGDLRLNKPIVGMAATPSGRGYWLVASDGGIFAFGDAGFHGSTGALRLNRPIVGMAATPTGGGYWLVASDGGTFAFGDAVFHGSTGALRLNQPIVGMAATPTGGGYWLVASDGGIFAFGDAVFQGSTGAIRLNRPIVGMATTPSGAGYWLVASDGGIFAFGGASFQGSTGAIPLNQPIVGMARTASGAGYWLVASDGGIFAFGDAAFLGSTGAVRLNQPIVGMAR